MPVNKHVAFHTRTTYSDHTLIFTMQAGTLVADLDILVGLICDEHAKIFLFKLKFK